MGIALLGVEPTRNIAEEANLHGIPTLRLGSSFSAHTSGVLRGLAWLNPMPLESDIARAYANYHTHEDFTPPRRPVNLGPVRRTWRWMKAAYLAEEFGCGEIAPGMRRKLACLAVNMLPPFREQLEAPYRYLHGRKKGRVLDVGCGNGEMLQVAQRMGWDAESVEVDPLAALCTSDAPANRRGR